MQLCKGHIRPKTLYSQSPMQSSESQPLPRAAGAVQGAADQARPGTVPQQNGILVLDKPSGPTSTACLNRLKRLGQKKIGHAGTLDPMADGVLLVLLGNATKLSNHLLQSGCKVYSATVELGRETTTWDAEGETVATAPLDGINAEAIAAVVNTWSGEIEQIVPPYSAAKSNGQPLYRLARAGREVPVKLKTVTIFRADLLQVELPLVRFRVRCGSGTYIRSLAHSLGKRLGCGATLVQLTREYSHPFDLGASVSLDDILNDPEILPSRVRGIGEALPDWPILDVDQARARLVRNGNALPCPPELAGTENLLIRCGGEILALGRIVDGRVAVARGLWS